MDSVERNLKSKGTVSKKFTVPMLLWQEWEDDCKENFNNTYYAKMLSDHDFKKNFEPFINLVVQDLLDAKNRILNLESRVEELEGKPEEKPKKTFG